MAATPKTMTKHLLSTCVDANSVQEIVCDEIMQEFPDFMYTSAKSELEKFSIENDCLDTFLCSKMAINYPTAWSVIEMTLLVTWTGFS